jgi:signal transduction histidine kinase
MEFVRTFFELNRDIILFTYGLVFFILGLAITLQSRRYSRLDLAKGLSWLAAFGFVHGFYEWGDLFIPLQATYLSPPYVELLRLIHLLLLGISFACLFTFGVVLLQPLGWARWLHLVPAGLLAAWIFVAFFPLPALLPTNQDWHNIANALARYFIGLPGALLAAYGLRQQTYRRIAPLQVPHIVRMLRYAGLCLAFYALLGGLIPPPIPFFPGNLLNAETFEQWFIVPPMFVRSLVGLTLALTIIRALEVFEVETERMIEAMEQQQILAAERERIGRELHDGAIQKVYTAGLLVESAQKFAEAETPIASRLDKAVVVLQDAIVELRRNLVELRPTPAAAPAGGKSLADALQDLVHATRFRSLVEIDLVLELPDGEAMLSPPRTGHVLAIVTEALANVVRHARAQHVHIRAGRDNGRLQLTIQDDGIGINPAVDAGHGLRNMRDRARLLGGSLEINNTNGKGTLVRLDVPWREEL